jgi:DNA adenine methylase
VASLGNDTKIKPFLRWVGGKRWLIPEISRILENFKVANYHEPFLGGGAVFFSIKPSGRIYLSDLNLELVETYIQIAGHPIKVFDALQCHSNTSKHYYALRDSEEVDPVAKAARFIYLNHASFNGIYRVNQNGEYNVPFGNRDDLCLPTRSEFLAISRCLRSAEIAARDFEVTADKVSKGDLVFLDPPYTVAHNNNGFVKYNQKIFSFDDQKRLKTLIEIIRDREAFYIMTNAAHESITRLFDFDDRVIVTTRKNTVGGMSAKRGVTEERLFTNIGARD